jgi:xanthine dehydrogenase accessory factor
VSKDIDVWKKVRIDLEAGFPTVLLIVVDSSGSSPGRAGYKMAVAADGELCGSIGGGVMEVNLVDRARAALSEPGAVTAVSHSAEIIEQVHQKHSFDASGMICSGRQTVISMVLTHRDLATVNAISASLGDQISTVFEISNLRFQIVENTSNGSRYYFSKASETDFVYQERLGSTNDLIIIGGGHCALALSELMSKLDFRVRIYDDRPELNTLSKNDFADEITIINDYAKIGEHIQSGENNQYVAVMTLGYASDAVVIRQLIDQDFEYFGVLGSKAKMATLMKELRLDGYDEKRLSDIRTPIGLPINSRTPEEIAISIAAEIIGVKNGSELSA